MKKYYLYILASRKNGTLYIGVTSDLIKRVWQHKQKLVEGFTQKYNVSVLVYFEEYSDVKDALKREKNMKAWQRQWKIKIIEENNPNWEDLYSKIVQKQNDYFLDPSIRWDDKTFAGEAVPAKKDGKIAKDARVALEEKTGQSVVTGENFLPTNKSKGELR